MKKFLPTRVLPKHPDLDQLRRQAKDLLDAVRTGEPSALAEAAARYPGVDPQKFALHDAQLVLARAYGFHSWTRLKAYLSGGMIKRRNSIPTEAEMSGTRSPPLRPATLPRYDV